MNTDKYKVQVMEIKINKKTVRNYKEFYSRNQSEENPTGLHM